MRGGNVVLEKLVSKTKLSYSDCCATCENVSETDGKLQCLFLYLDEGLLFVQPWVVCEKYRRHSHFNYPSSNGLVPKEL